MALYLKNDDLLREVIRARELGYVTNELGAMFMLMVDQYSKKSWWNGYTYLDDMKSNAHVALVNAAFKFNPAAGSNAFSYYTSVITNAFLQIKYDERDHRDIRDSILVKHGLDPSFAFQEQMKADDMDKDEKGYYQEKFSKPEPEEDKDKEVDDDHFRFD